MSWPSGKSSPRSAWHLSLVPHSPHPTVECSSCLQPCSAGQHSSLSEPASAGAGERAHSHSQIVVLLPWAPGASLWASGVSPYEWGCFVSSHLAAGLFSYKPIITCLYAFYLLKSCGCGFVVFFFFFFCGFIPSEHFFCLFYGVSGAEQACVCTSFPQPDILGAWQQCALYRWQPSELCASPPAGLIQVVFIRLVAFMCLCVCVCLSVCLPPHQPQ